MALRTFTIFFWACLIATAALAGEEHRTRIEIDGSDLKDDTRAHEAHEVRIIKKEFDETN